jgi:hypothetical protein
MVRDHPSVPASCGFVLTDSGREALATAPTCPCSLMWSEHGVVHCLECKTVYGVLGTLRTRNGNNLLRWQLAIP